MAEQALVNNAEIICPNYDNITCSTGEWNLFLGPIPTYISLVSSSLSCIGASAIIITYILYRDLRTGSRSIITYLSIADFFTSLGYIVGGSNYLTSSSDADCDRFDTVCAIQSYVTTWSQLSSYVWNCALAVYLFLTIASGKNRLANRLIPFFHIIAWGFPIAVALPLLGFDYLGFSPYSASNWCFIKDLNYQNNQWLSKDVIIPIMVARIIPEFFTYVIIIILYAIIKYFVFKMKRRLKAENKTGLLDLALKRIDNKLLLIPLAFILLRIWGFVQFFLILTSSHFFKSGCVSYPVHVAHFTLGIMEAIGEGGQGWINAFLFIILNAKTRYLICRQCSGLMPCCKPKRVIMIPPSDYSSTTKRTATLVSSGSDPSIDEGTLNSNSTGLHEVGAESFFATGVVN